LPLKERIKKTGINLKQKTMIYRKPILIPLDLVINSKLIIVELLLAHILRVERQEWRNRRNVSVAVTLLMVLELHVQHEFNQNVVVVLHMCEQTEALPTTYDGGAAC
jgi:hypothetical protein